MTGLPPPRRCSPSRPKTEKSKFPWRGLARWLGIKPPPTKEKSTWNFSIKLLPSGLADPQATRSHTSRLPLNNFTPRAQRVLALARKEADRFHHNYVGTEHLLLGLISLNQGVGVSVLQKLGLDFETLRAAVEKQVGFGPEEPPTGNIPYTPRVKKALALAQKEARMLQHSNIGTEHILLGILREGDGVAARVLRSLGVDIERCRNEILQELGPNFSGEAGASRFGPAPAPDGGEKPPVRSFHTRPDKTYVVPADAWTRAFLAGLKRPSEIEELSKEIDKVSAQKDEAIAKMNFEEAAKCRDQENKLRAMRDERTERWAQTPEGRTSLGKLGEALAAAFGEQRKTFHLDVILPDVIQALSRARREADWFHYDCIATEHVLLALLSHRRDTVVGLLAKMGVEPAAVRAEIGKQITAGTQPGPTKSIPFTPGVIRALGLAREEATALRRSRVGLEHLLLGLLREGDGIAARVLTNLRVDYEPLRNLCAAQPPT